MKITQAVPFFAVSEMERSLRYYLDGLGFEMKIKWIDEGKLRWCWLQHGEAALMLQEFRKGPDGKVGAGVSINFICDDAIAFYHAFKSRGVDVSRPFVGNGMWVTSSSDPDGYKLSFESKTDTPEETQYTE